MRSVRLERSRIGQLRLFVASLWLALATALFCAVVPLGLPHTEARGSAFNPSNSVVALHAAGSHRGEFKRLLPAEPARAASQAADLLLAGAAAFVVLFVAGAALPEPARLARLPLYPERRFRLPRGPPRA